MSEPKSTDIVRSPAPDLQPVTLFTPTPKATERVLEFFTTQINNDHTRKAYLNATRRFAAWCEGRGIGRLRSTAAEYHPQLLARRDHVGVACRD